MPEADRTTPQTIKKKIRRKKPAPKPAYKLPSNFKTQAAADRPRQQTAGPVKPQQTGRAKPQPIARKKLAPPTTTDTTSDAKRQQPRTVELFAGHRRHRDTFLPCRSARVRAAGRASHRPDSPGT